MFELNLLRARSGTIGVDTNPESCCAFIPQTSKCCFVDKEIVHMRNVIFTPLISKSSFHPLHVFASAHVQYLLIVIHIFITPEALEQV